MLILAVIYSILIVFFILRVYFLGFGNKWALLTMDQWIISNIILLGIFFGLNIIFILHHYMVKKKRIEGKKPKPLKFKGKKLHTYTLPTDSKGGIYSKTFVKIDENNILNFRIQMVPPYLLWGKKEEE